MNVICAAAGLIGWPFQSRASALTRSGARQSKKPRMAIIIDDIGFSRHKAQAFLGIEADLTYAVLPRLRFSNDLADEIHESGHEVLLHQPMEPFSKACDPGPGALYVGDEAARIQEVMSTNLEEIPHAIGVNNHMGSKFTARHREMLSALSVVRSHRLFFIDSLTSIQSAGVQTAHQLHLAVASRDVFLDNSPTPEAILRQIEHLVHVARKCGCAVGIGHPFSQTAEALARFLGENGHAGVDLVPASHILDL